MVEALPVSVTEQSKPAVFRRVEGQAPVLGAQVAVIIWLNSATVEISEGTSQQTMQAVLFALQNVCLAISRLQKIYTLPTGIPI